MKAKQLDHCLDIELLQGYLDSLGKAIIEKMFALYCQQVTIYLKDIANAQVNNSLSDWEIHCHKMKGAAASVGMCQLHGQLKLIEKTVATQEQRATLLKELTLANEQAIFAFKRWLDDR